MYRMGGRAEHAVSVLRLPRVLVGCVLLRCCTLRRTSCVECDMLHCCGLEVGWMFDQSRRFACGMSQLCAVSCTLHRCCTGSSTSMPYCRGRTRSETSPSAPLPPSLFAAHAPARTGLNNGLCGHPRVEALECPRTNARAEHTPLCIAWPLFRLSRWNLPCRAIVQNATCNRRTFPMNHINQSPAGPGVVPQLHG